MVVSCPNCKTRLRIPEEKIKSGGSTFKCPKCDTHLRVKKPGKKKIELDANKVVVAFEKPEVLQRVVSVLTGAGYTVYTAADGVEVMVKAMKEFPFMNVLDIAIPKINGYEIARRLKTRTETRDMKIILVSSPGDDRRQRKMPPSAYGIDGYADDDNIEEELLPLIKPKTEKKQEPPFKSTLPEGVTSPSIGSSDIGTDDMVERAKRLARTVLSDIELYSPDRAVEAIRNDNFQSVFSEELREGLKLYERRIPEDVRNMGNFFQDAVDSYIEKKRKSMGLSY